LGYYAISEYFFSNSRHYFTHTSIFPNCPVLTMWRGSLFSTTGQLTWLSVVLSEYKIDPFSHGDAEPALGPPPGGLNCRGQASATVYKFLHVCTVSPGVQLIYSVAKDVFMVEG